MQIGDVVIVRAPFNYLFQGVYVIEAIKEDGTCVIDTDRDFDPKFLELVE